MLKGKILFDLGHGEDRLDALMDKLPEQMFSCETSEKKLTSTNLQNYNTLAIVNPKLKFSEEEFHGIKKYVESGGGLILYADYRGEIEYKIFCNSISLNEKRLDTELLNGNSFMYKKGTDYNWSSNIPNVIVSDDPIVKDFSDLRFEPPVFGYIEQNNLRKLIRYKSRFLDDWTKTNSGQSSREHYRRYKDESEKSLKAFDSNKLKESERHFDLRSEYFDKSRELMKKAYEELDEKTEPYSYACVASFLGAGRIIGIYGNFFSNKFIKNKPNLLFAINIFEWLTQPTLYKQKEKLKTRPSFIHP